MVVNFTFRENSSDELNNKLKVANDNKHILNTETYRLEAIKNSYNAASQRQKEIIEVHQDEELRKYGQIKELQKQIESVTDVLAMKQVTNLTSKSDLMRTKIKGSRPSGAVAAAGERVKIRNRGTTSNQ